jgi:hypothetical protein
MVIEIHQPVNVYMDESCQGPKDKQVYSVSGYLSSFERWVALEREWKQILEHYGVPYFHAKDFMARQDIYKNLNWSTKRRYDFVVRLATTASEHTIVGVGCAIREDEYERTMPVELKQKWKDPYGFCLYSVFCLLNQLENNTRLTLPSKPLYLMFDTKPKFKSVANKVLDDFNNVPELSDVFGDDVAFGDDKKYPPLQAADLLSWVTTREYVNTGPLVKAAIEILDRKDFVWIVKPTEEMLQKYVEFVKQAGQKPSASDRLLNSDG